MGQKDFPEWGKTAYRGIRAGVSAGIIAVLALKLDLSKPEEAVKLVVLTFGTAFLVAFGKWAREKLDKWMGFDEKSLIAKAMPI